VKRRTEFKKDRRTKSLGNWIICWCIRFGSVMLSLVHNKEQDTGHCTSAVHPKLFHTQLIQKILSKVLSYALGFYT